MRDAAAFVCSDTGVILAQNELAKVLTGDRVDRRHRAASRAWSGSGSPIPAHASRLRPTKYDGHSRSFVADLRASWARRRTDADMRELVDGLLEHSPEFAALWARHEVAVRRMQRKTFLTTVGPITLDCEVLVTADGQMLVVLTPPPGSSALEDLRLLAVFKDQAMGPH